MEKPILAAILSCSGPVLTDAEKRIFAASNPLGVSLFARNIKNKEQLKKLISDIKNTINRDDILIAADQEGGRVTRLSSISKRKFVSAEMLGAAEIKYSKMHAELIAEEMRQLGVNLNFAPIVEQKQEQQTPVLEGRCFSSNIKRIVNRAKIMADTYINWGICPCIKHLPGHFDMDTDPHLQGYVSTISKIEIMRKIQYLKAFNKYPLAMTSHIVLKSIDETSPVSMSEKCIELLRKKLGFEGFIISDAIDMHALKGNIIERAQKCWKAGIDAICYCSGLEKDLENLAKSKYFLTDKSLIRFAKIKKVLHNIPKEIDIKGTEKLYKKYFADKKDIKYAYDATEVLNKMLEKEKKG